MTRHPAEPSDVATLREATGDISVLAERWEAARTAAQYFCEDFDTFQATAEAEEGARYYVAQDAGPDTTGALLIFRREDLRHKFTVGERRVGSIPMHVLSLCNYWMAEGHAPQIIAKLVEQALTQTGADLVMCGEISDASVLHRALAQMSWPLKPLRIGRKTSLRWLVDLPGDFDSFLTGLSSSTRQSTRRKIRKLEKDFDVRVEVISTPDAVGHFLEAGETISRMTYQWHVGQKLCNDVATQAHYRMLAKEGRLRCYLLYLDGEPKAFLRGTLGGNLYHYETPGFDPKLSKQSIGQYLLLIAIRDLIEQTTCRVFDFGTGGDETGYKSTYGNRSLSCASFYVLRLSNARSLLIWLCEGVLTRLKNMADRIIPKGDIRNRIKRRLRKHS